MIRLLVVDDHPVVRAGMRALLEAQGDVYIVGEAAEGEAALRLAETLRPDGVLLDCRLPGIDGVTVARALRERCPAARTVALSTHADGCLVWGMLEAGAVGYVLKDEPPEAILAAVRAAAQVQPGLDRGEKTSQPPRGSPHWAKTGGPIWVKTTGPLWPKTYGVL